MAAGDESRPHRWLFARGQRGVADDNCRHDYCHHATAHASNADAASSIADQHREVIARAIAVRFISASAGQYHRLRATLGVRRYWCSCADVGFDKPCH